LDLVFLFSFSGSILEVRTQLPLFYSRGTLNFLRWMVETYRFTRSPLFRRAPRSCTLLGGSRFMLPDSPLSLLE